METGPRIMPLTWFIFRVMVLFVRKILFRLHMCVVVGLFCVCAWCFYMFCVCVDTTYYQFTFRQPLHTISLQETCLVFINCEADVHV